MIKESNQKDDLFYNKLLHENMQMNMNDFV